MTGRVSAGDFGPRLELQRHLEVGDRPRIISFGPVGFAATVVGEGVVRIELNRLVEVTDRPLIITLPYVERATVDVGSGLSD